MQMHHAMMEQQMIQDQQHHQMMTMAHGGPGIEPMAAMGMRPLLGDSHAMMQQRMMMQDQQ